MIIDAILSVADKLFGFRNALLKADRERRDRTSDLLQHISDCLSRVAADLDHDVMPHGACGELQTYAALLPDMITVDGVPAVDAVAIGTELWEAHNVEMLFYETKDPAGKVYLLGKLHTASGQLRALANLLKVA